MKTIRSLLVVVVFALVLILIGTAPLEAQQGRIRGELYGLDGEPLPDAQIFLDQSDGGGNLHYELESDSSGLFVHLSVTLARYQLTLVVDGRQTAIAEVNIGSGENPIRLDLSRGEIENWEFSRLLGVSERVVRELVIIEENEVAAIPGGANPFDNSEEREALEAADASMREAFDAGRQALDSGDYEEAIRQFNLAAEAAPAPVHIIYGNLGLAYERAQRYDEAVESYEEAQATVTAQEIPPEQTNYYNNLTLAYAMAGNVEKAMENAEKAVEVNPGDAGAAFYNVGVVLTNAGQTAAAAEVFQRATEVDPDNADAYFQLGLNYVGSDLLVEAVPVFEKYLELVPEGPDAETARQLIEFVEQQ